MQRLFRIARATKGDVTCCRKILRNLAASPVSKVRTDPGLPPLRKTRAPMSASSRIRTSAFDRHLASQWFVLYFSIMGTVQEILTAMDKLSPEELRIVKFGVDSRLSNDDNDPALLAALQEAVAYADAHPGEAKSIDEVRALIPQWISESRSKSRQ